MENCFVIQPFDNDKFDRRFVDVFEPAIRNAGYVPYRIDKDPSIRIPIDGIEKGIRESAICFAEITLDNPNVWYELGFAFACDKDVIMVCSDEREGKKFPFDIQHRHIITYKTNSKSDYTNLEESISKKIAAFQHKKRTVKSLHDTPIKETEGLKSHEIALLILIMENSISIDDCYSIYSLKNEMNKSGYTDIATSVGIRTLSKLGMIETFKEIDVYTNGQEYHSCRLTEIGEDWILSNQDQLQFRLSKDLIEEDDLPF